MDSNRYIYKGLERRGEALLEAFPAIRKGLAISDPVEQYSAVHALLSRGENSSNEEIERIAISNAEDSGALALLIDGNDVQADSKNLVMLPRVF